MVSGVLSLLSIETALVERHNGIQMRAAWTVTVFGLRPDLGSCAMARGRLGRSARSGRLADQTKQTEEP